MIFSNSLSWYLMCCHFSSSAAGKGLQSKCDSPMPYDAPSEGKVESVVWCGVVWCGVVWCGVVWYGVVCCGVAWYGVVWCGVVWRGMVWRGVVWCGVVWFGE